MSYIKKMLARIPIAQMRLGMFLHAVDASWADNPFWRSRFEITSMEEIETLRQANIATVVIDLTRGVGPKLPSARGTYAADRQQAGIVVDLAKTTMKDVFEEIRLGGAVRSDAVRHVVDDIAGSLKLNASAFIDIVRLKSKDEYTYLHSVAVCALMVNLARHMKLDEPLIRDLGLAGLVHDIGKVAIPNAILDKPGPLDDDEFALVRTHPQAGVDMLMRGGDIPPVVIDVCHHHHEKIDGTGYPFARKGDEISLAARMGAVCDVYDAVTSARPYKEAWSPEHTVTAMSGWTGQFDPDVLFAFFQSIGVFPAGLLIRMDSGHLAVVLPNGRRGSRPRVLQFYAIADKVLIPPRELVLDDVEAPRQIVSREDPIDWDIHDWPALQAHLLSEPAVFSASKIRRCWYAPMRPATVPASQVPGATRARIGSQPRMG